MKDWLPDRTDSSNYPDPETTSMGEWAWEFLRRNSSYQADYKALADKVEQIDKDLEDKLSFHRGLGDKLSQLYEFLDDESALILQHLVRRQFDLSEFDKSVGEIFSYFRDKYGVVCWGDLAPDPSFSYQKSQVRFILDYVPSMNKHACKVNKSRKSTIEVNPRSLVIEISLEHSVKEQVNIIKKVANAQQKQLREWNLIEPPRKRVLVYPGYLQLLDALEVGAEHRKILYNFFKNVPNEYPDYLANKNFNNWKEAAETLRDSGYLKLASLHTPTID